MVKTNIDRFKIFEGVFDEFTLNTLEFLKRKQYFDELGKPIKTGKEGDVYYAFKNKEKIAIKIYRLSNSNFKKINSYISLDYRFKNIKGNKRKIILIWVQKEYRNLSICHQAGMNVPYVYKQANNIILMEYIDGFMLKDVNLKNPKKYFELLIKQIYILKNKAKLIHADLSEFNIMSCEEIPYIIDFGQAMSIKNDSELKLLYDYYYRDISNITNYFNKKYKLNLNIEKILTYLDN